jgi:HAD superfamily hydrolase (TIGR01509 family)
MFDDFLRLRAQRTGEAFRPFDAGSDYDRYVDGKPRADGVRSFLASRDIELPEGGDADGLADETVAGLGNHKNTLVLKLFREQGVEVFPGSVDFVRRARELGKRVAVVTSSANAEEVLRAAGIPDLFEVRVDGLVAKAEGIPGKPRPDTFIAAARKLGYEPSQAVVFEDALAGVEAGKAGGFGLVVGVDRVGQAEDLRARGADVVVSDLSELLAD